MRPVASNTARPHHIGEDRTISHPEQVSRRVFLGRVAGLTLALGAGPIESTDALPPDSDPYARGIWLAGDHHIHTQYSPDGQYRIEQQVGNALRNGLNWCVITDHGGPSHDRIALEQAYPDLLAARRRYPGILVFQGLEWNIPSAEHASIIVPFGSSEASTIAQFEAMYDGKNISRADHHNVTEADAIEGIRYLQQLDPKPIFIANHPARRGFDSPHEMRGWAEAGPDVVRGFEGAPGHQAAGLVGAIRGEYGGKAGPTSYPGFAPESYWTHGGYDWYVARVGGLWDSLLSEGRPWYITSNSDSHRHYTDRTIVNSSTYLTRGHVTPTDRKMAAQTNIDFFPGEYSKLWVFAQRRSHTAILDAMRAGSMFTVLGGLVDRLKLTARSDSRTAVMGASLAVERPGRDVAVTITVHEPDRPNAAGERPHVHHIDLIAGSITGPVADHDAQTNPTTRVVKRFEAANAHRDRGCLTFRHVFRNVQDSFYIRIRGTNTDVTDPRIDKLVITPWSDLWFYSNPIFIRLA